jgi:hypothetical protein
MYEIEGLTEALIAGSPTANEMLNHLYELHRLRDKLIYDAFIAVYSLQEEITDHLWEMNYA